MPLTDAKVRSAKPADKTYRLPDGKGLYLEVRPTGGRFWRYRFELPPGKESMFTIGEYPTVGLSDARAQRDWAREQVRRGVSPTVARENERAKVSLEAAETFKVVAEEWYSENAKHWTQKYANKVRTVFETDVYPAIGHRPIKEIGSAEVLALLRSIENRDAKTIAILARQRCSSVFRYAISTLRAEADPTLALHGAIKRNPVRHHPHLTRDELPTLLRRMEGYGGYLPTKICMKLLMLTFVRTGELRQAEWEEFDLDGARLGLGGPTWAVPVGRMKRRRPHVVPLPTQAVALLTELRTLTGNQRFLFPNMRQYGACMSITTINRALERMGYGGEFSGHGFRSTASTILHEMGYSSDHIEAQLAHKDKSVRGIYNHARYLPERRKMLQEWADLVDELAATPVDQS